jgi:hypothetical protein
MGFFGADFGPETSSATAVAEIRPAVSMNTETADFNDITFMALLKGDTKFNCLGSSSNLLLR